MSFEEPATQYLDDPSLVKNCKAKPCFQAMMGDIIFLPAGAAYLKISVDAAAPVLSVDIFNGTDQLECYHPYDESDLGDRITVLWEGAEYRGRFRSVSWDGTAHFDEATIASATPVNFFNRDKKLDITSSSDLSWQSVTTGNFAGFVAKLNDSKSGSIALKTPLINESMKLADIGYEGKLFDASDILPRRIQMFRLPNDNPHTSVRIERKLEPLMGRDNPFYVRITLEDGTRAWSSPIYILREI